MSTQWLSQAVSLGGTHGTHVLAVQMLFGSQACPQAPQLSGSDVRSTQVSPQSVVPAGHTGTQVPDEQASPNAQACPHAPQFEASDR